MRVRGLVLMATVLAVAAAPAAATEKKKRGPAACHLIVDPAGDTALSPPLSGGDPYDILYADIARGRTQLVAVLRVLSGPDATDRAPAGAEWRFGLSSEGRRYEFTARRATTGVETSSVAIGDDAAVPHSFAVVRDVLVWTVKLPRAKQPATTITDATAQTEYGPLTVDSATGQRSGERKGCARAK